MSLLIDTTVAKIEDAISRFSVRRQIRWVDTDASGFVHISAFVRLLEETEYEFLRSCGLSVVLTDEKGLMGFPRLSTGVSINRPLVFDETVVIDLMLMEVDGKKVDYRFHVSDEEGKRVGDGNFTVAVCRFPTDALPYAVLTPEFVIDALIGSASNNNKVNNN